MLTRCPYCKAEFEFSAEQLAARQGFMRCARCRGVYKAHAPSARADLRRPPAVPLQSSAATAPARAEIAAAAPSPAQTAPADESFAAALSFATKAQAATAASLTEDAANLAGKVFHSARGKTADESAAASLTRANRGTQEEQPASALSDRAPRPAAASAPWPGESATAYMPADSWLEIEAEPFSPLSPSSPVTAHSQPHAMAPGLHQPASPAAQPSGARLTDVSATPAGQTHLRLSALASPPPEEKPVITLEPAWSQQAPDARSGWALAIEEATIAESAAKTGGDPLAEQLATEDLTATATAFSATALPPAPLSDLLLDQPAAAFKLPKAPRPPVSAWAVVLSLCLTLLLAGQVAIQYRSDLAAQAPASRPLLMALCRLAGCRLMLPRNADLLSIEDSSLQRDAAGNLVLAATLKNRAAFAQEYPALELSLTDTLDAPVARRVLMPSDYLPPRVSPSKGIAAKGENLLRFAIEPNDLASVGYRLYLFYP